MDSVQWAQEMGAMEDSRYMVEKRARPQKDLALNCPRCNSTNTKFCYYNNYSFSQPRYFCKTCRRYWTEGGSLRNVPVGGCSRKNKRTTSSSSKKLPDQSNPPIFSDQSASQKPKIHEGHEFNLAYLSDPKNPSSSSASSHLSALELSRGLSSFMLIPVSDSNTAYSSGFSLQGSKPNLNFSLDGYDGGLQGVQESGARLFFPIEDLKQQISCTAGTEQNGGIGFR